MWVPPRRQSRFRRHKQRQRRAQPMRSLLGIITFIGVLAATEPAAAQSAHYKVIVNANNPAAVLMASEVSRIYLGIANVWPDRTLAMPRRSEEHTSELQSLRHLVCRLLLEKKKKNSNA